MKTYLGDSVYIAPSEDGFVLTTENGDGAAPSNIIYLEPQTAMRLRIHIEECLRLSTIETPHATTRGTGL